MIELKPLELGHYPTVYQWTERYPWPSEVSDYAEWKEQMLNRLTAATFEGSELLGVFSFDVLGQGVLQLHIDTPSSCVLTAEGLLVAALSIRKQLFEDSHTQLIVGWTPAGNRGVVRLAGACGLKWDGVEMFQGRRRWIRLSITREEYEQQKQTDQHYNPERNTE